MSNETLSYVRNKSISEIFQVKIPVPAVASQMGRTLRARETDRDADATGRPPFSSARMNMDDEEKQNNTPVDERTQSTESMVSESVAMRTYTTFD